MVIGQCPIRTPINHFTSGYNMGKQNCFSVPKLLYMCNPESLENNHATEECTWGLSPFFLSDAITIKNSCSTEFQVVR